MNLYVYVATYILFFNLVDSKESCYWNAQCSYQLYSTKTPYDTVRGDIRDYSSPPNCQAVSIWNINRHGNRNPGYGTTDEMKSVSTLRDEIVESYEAGRSRLCAQDIENLKSWSWNETLDVSPEFLTGIGYEEIFNIGKRIRERYPQLLNATEDKFYFRPTMEQRTFTSSLAFVHGLTQGTGLNLSVDGPWDRDGVIRPYKICDKYEQEVKGGETMENHINSYINSGVYRSVQSRVQERLGISTQISLENVYSLYELCRFYRSWSPTLQSPWCAVFSDEDLVILEYLDDVIHYYRNGYGSWVNVKLGGLTLKDLYENFEAVINGTGRNIVSYFTHDTMMEMIFCALGIFKDNFILNGTVRNPNRLWRTSFISSFSTNFIAVLNKCEESSGQTYRVQLYINEMETELCPIDGCTWDQFQEKISSFKDANLDFCSLDYRDPDTVDVSDTAYVHKTGLIMVLTSVLLTGSCQ